jgi:hypothetical protein
VYFWSDGSIVTERNLSNSSSSPILLILSGARTFTTIDRNLLFAHEALVEIDSNVFSRYSPSTANFMGEYGKRMFARYTEVQLTIVGSFSHKEKRLKYFTECLTDTDNLLLFARMLFCTQFLLPWPTEKEFLHTENLTLLTSVSTLITNEYSRLKTPENKHFILGGATSLKFKHLLIIDSTKDFVVKTHYCVLTINSSTLPRINRFINALHVTNRYRFQYEAKIAIKLIRRKGINR